MTPTPLLTRVLAATEGSRELDLDVYRALGCSLTDTGYWDKAINGTPFWQARWRVVYPNDPQKISWLIQPIATDLSAALTLVERVRPGWTIELRMFPGGKAICHLLRYVDHEYEGFVALGPKGELPHTPALAILAALLMSLEGEQ